MSSREDDDARLALTQYEELRSRYGGGNDVIAERYLEQEGVLRLAARHGMVELFVQEAPFRRDELCATTRGVLGVRCDVEPPLVEAMTGTEGSNAFRKLRIAQKLLDLAPEAVDIPDLSGRMPLELAAMNGLQAFVGVFLAVDADVNAGKASPLFHAELGYLKARDPIEAMAFDHIRVALLNQGAVIRPREGDQLVENRAPPEIAFRPALPAQWWPRR